MIIRLLSTLVFFIGLLPGCSGVSGLPEGWRKDRSSEIPSNPIVTESGREPLDGEMPKEPEKPNADVPFPPMMAFSSEDCLVAGGIKTVTVTDANAATPLTIDGTAVVHITARNKTVSITSIPVVDTICLSSNGIGNVVNLVMKMRVGKLYVTTSGSSEKWNVVTDIEGWTTNTTLVGGGNANSFKFSGMGNFDCPKTDQVTAGNVVECVPGL